MLTLFGSAPGPFNDALVRQQLDAMSRPRSVTIAWRDRIIQLLAFLFLCLWATLWTRGLVEGWGKRTSWDIFGVLFLLVFVSLWLVEVRRELKNYSLLADGDFALGRVISQRTISGKSKRSVVTYEFTDMVGRTWTGKGNDSTKKYVENMPVIIFYDQYDPQKSVAICTTVWRVRKPDGKLIGFN